MIAFLIRLFFFGFGCLSALISTSFRDLLYKGNSGFQYDELQKWCMPCHIVHAQVSSAVGYGYLGGFEVGC